MVNTRRWRIVLLAVLCWASLTACATQTGSGGGDNDEDSPNAAPAATTETIVAEFVGDSSPAATEEPAADTKDLTICMGQEPDTLYPYGGSMLAASAVQHAIFENNITTLSFDYQAQGLEKIPSLADGDARLSHVEVNAGDIVVAADGNLVIVESGIVLTNSDGEEVVFDGAPVVMEQLIVDFTLKARTWNDGKPVTAQDSVYSFNLVADPATPQTKFTVSRTASYEATGELSTRWIGIPGFYDSTYFTNFWQPLPEHIWGQFTAVQLLAAEESSRLPVGDGPFAIQEWVEGDHIYLTPNEFYYQEGLPYLDSVTFKFIPDTNSLISQLLAGDCDIATQDALGTDHSPFLLEAESNGLLVPYFQTGTVWEHIDFGINPDNGVRRPDWYEDVRVRQAIAMCTDRQRMVDDILFGRSEVVHSYIPSVHPLYAAGLTVWPYDVEAANALLDEVGYLDSDGDGIREDPATGAPFAPTLSTTMEIDMRKQLTQIFKENLLECGIDVQLDYMLSSELYASGPEGLIFGRKFDLVEFAWGTGVQPPCDFYLSSEIPTAENDWAGQNNTGFTDAAYDAACLMGIASLPGTTTYQDGHAEAQRLFSEQLPVLPLFLRLKVAAARPHVLNFGVDPTQNSEIYNIFELDLQQ
ncbi:MAG: peptide ABC transporter substrate-binding protein [Ardenticatenaceae bacterium]|nr:peptide ABC transporter substrate-binding protein [Ardenticatenaceae bacterium]